MSQGHDLDISNFDTDKTHFYPKLQAPKTLH